MLMEMVRRMFKRAHLPEDTADQAYYEANVENALIEHHKIIDRQVEIARRGDRTNEKLREGITHMRQAAERREDPMAELVRGMRSSRR